MSRKTLLIILSGLVIAAITPWKNIKFFNHKVDDCQTIIDSLENEMNEARMSYMKAGEEINALNDSLYRMSRLIDKNNENYAKLRKQNEKLQKERAAIINGFTDDDIEQYCSNRYDKKDNN